MSVLLSVYFPSLFYPPLSSSPLIPQLLSVDFFSPSPLSSTLLIPSPSSSKGLRHLPSNLSHLNLFGCYNITDEGLLYLPPGLKSLDLSWYKRNISSITFFVLDFLQHPMRWSYVGSSYRVASCRFVSCSVFCHFTSCHVVLFGQLVAVPVLQFLKNKFNQQ